MKYVLQFWKSYANIFTTNYDTVFQKSKGFNFFIFMRHVYQGLFLSSFSQKNIPEFKIEPEIALELLMASNYLDC